jgi:CHAT domain-containing protein
VVVVPGDRNRGTGLLVIANPVSGDDLEPLPASEREAKTLAKIYGDVTAFTRDGATPAAYREHAADAEIIHFATHGEIPANGKGEAALVLTGGRLDVTAIAKTRLPNTRAVIVAACGSALGTDRAEGTISVARAFLEAGVPSVIATLWSISDTDAARFFPLVHRHLARGAAPADALRAAQLEAIRQGLPPAIWAAVECMGSGGITGNGAEREGGRT